MFFLYEKKKIMVTILYPPLPVSIKKIHVLYVAATVSAVGSRRIHR